jgi:predicted metal-dependent peptidase
MRAVKLFDATADLTNSRRYIAALIILQSKAPVHYSLLMATDVVWTDAMPTAGTDGVYVYVNPEFFRGLASDSQRAFLLAHEAAHIILRHPQRGQMYADRGHFRVGIPFDGALYNKCADYVINADCLSMGLERIENGCYSGKYGRDDLVDSVYAELAQPDTEEANDDEQGDEQGSEQGDEQASSGAGGGDDADGDDASGSGGTDGAGDSDAGLPDPAGHDYHLSPKYSGDADEQAAAADADKFDLGNAVDDGVDEAARCGISVGGNIVEGGTRVQAGTASDIPWQDELADLLRHTGDGGKVTWSQIKRRRFAMMGVISPERRGDMQRMSVIVDISGSVCRESMAQFMAEIATAVDELNPTDGCLVMFTNHEMHSAHEVYSGGELLDLEVPYGGGTYMASAVDFMTDNGLESDVTLCFTDCELWGDDWSRLAGAGVVVVADREIATYLRREANAANCRIITAAA